MRKKGQGQLVAFVLLIGFTVVIGLMVGNWAITKFKKVGSDITERGDVDTMCADVAIAQICMDTTHVQIKNKGLFKVRLKMDNAYTGGTDTQWIYPGKTSDTITISLNNQNIIPFIEVEGKEFGCPNRDIEIEACA